MARNTHRRSDRPHGPAKPESRDRVGRAIRAKQVRVIDANGDQLGVMAIGDALQTAERAGLDLVEVAPDATPAVCKIISYSKMRYAADRRERDNAREARHKNHQIRLRPNISDHDLQTKLRKTREFLIAGDTVRVQLIWSRRYPAKPAQIERVLERVRAGAADVGRASAEPRFEQNTATLALVPGADLARVTPDSD